MSNIPYLSTIEPPEFEPVTLAEAKEYLRLDSNTEDALLLGLIKTARQTAEEFLGKSLITQTLQLQFDYYAPTEVNLMRGPVQEIIAVIIVAADYTEGTLSSNAYHLTSGNKQLVFDAALMGRNVQIQYAAGYGNAADVPAPIKHGILQHVAAMYENRGQNDLPILVRQAYAPYKTIRI
mgnify:CR=1 FL=1